MNQYLKIRYLFDRLFALLLLPLCIPILMIISLIQFFVFGEIIFVQQRSGLHGKVFTLFKFISMNEDEEKTEEERTPAWGRWMRRTGLDELPQLLNIISGEMAFIGPRPLLPEYNSKYSLQQKERLNIKPGITGYAQATHRNDTTWKQRFEHDVYYVKHASLVLDLEIIFKSILQIFKGSPSKIMNPFEGNND